MPPLVSKIDTEKVSVHEHPSGLVCSEVDLQVLLPVIPLALFHRAVSLRARLGVSW